MTLNAEVSFDTFGNELGLLGASVGSLVTYLERRIALGAFRFKEFVILLHDCFGSDSKLMELQNFSQLIVDPWFIFVLISFCDLFMVNLVLGS